MKKWSFDADYLQACNCDYGCPCEFSAPPTTGSCHGVGVWRIEQGQYDGLALDGLGLGFAAKWPKAIHEGHGTVCLFVDEKASTEQRAALLEIGSGKPVGCHSRSLRRPWIPCLSRSSCLSISTSTD